MVDGDAEGSARLVARAADGDRDALEALYRRYVECVWRYAWFRSRDRDAAAEIVQETFLRLIRSVDRFEGRSSLDTWLYAIARSVAIEQSRKARRQGRLADQPEVLRLVRPDVDPPDALADETRREAVRRAVADLPGPQRDAIVLCELSGLSIRDAGQVLGWGQSRVKVTLFRARRRLRDLLSEQVDDASAKRSG
ncbi:MAG: RNA polymerase sigma factor [bacterium]|nr:RNA polymerase sigma factor [bacterium]